MDFTPPEHLKAGSSELTLLELLNTLETNLSAFEVAFDSVVHAFAAKVREERKERRAQIARAQPGVEHKFSPNVLLYRFHNGTVELAWTELWYKPNDPTTRYRRLPMAKGIAKIAAIVKGANPDEVDLIRHHEDMARQYRALWAHYQQVRKELGRFNRGTRKLLAAGE